MDIVIKEGKLQLTHCDMVDGTVELEKSQIEVIKQQLAIMPDKCPELDGCVMTGRITISVENAARVMEAVEKEKEPSVIVNAVRNSTKYHNSLAEDRNWMNGLLNLYLEKLAEGMDKDEAVSYVFQLMEKELRPYEYTFSLSDVPERQILARLEPNGGQTIESFCDQIKEGHLYGWIQDASGFLFGKVIALSYPVCRVMTANGRIYERKVNELAVIEMKSSESLFETVVEAYETSEGQIGAGTYNITFKDFDRTEDETQFDLKEGENWHDLYQLWVEFCKESDLNEDSITSIENGGEW